MELPRTGVNEPDAYRGANHEKVLARLFREHFGDASFSFCEVGVWSGYTAAFLLEQFPAMRYWGIDPFVPYSGANLSLLPLARQQCMERLSPYCNAMLLNMSSLAAAARFQDGCFDAVFIDDDHRYDSCLASCRAWWPKCSRLFTGHDYAGASVKRAVDEFTIEIGGQLVTEGCMVWRVYK